MIREYFTAPNPGIIAEYEKRHRESENQVRAQKKDARPNFRQCCSKTAKGLDCPIHADREHEGRAYCHVHDPNGKAQQNARKPRNPGACGSD